ncbi:MAG: hypothetical protein IJS60_08630 [Abditibacteriota bacterium]|nr:hypothetical protein [Abditibacteriota bacterium]
MKKILIGVLLLLCVGVFSADLQVTPYCTDAITYARINKINVILWFIDDNDATYKMRDEILLNGQLIAATEDVMWVIVDNSFEENRIISQVFGVTEFPTIMCIDKDGYELYGSRLSYGLLDRNILISDALLMSLVANDVIDWEIGDTWYDDRYVYNDLDIVEYTYWNNKPQYDYASDYYYDKKVSPYSGNTYDSVNLLAALLFLYQLYPYMEPVRSDYHTYHDRVIKVYRSYNNPPRRVLKFDDRPNPFVFWGYDSHHRDNIIHTLVEFERIKPPKKPRRIHTFSERMAQERRPLFEEEKMNPLKIDYKRSPFYKKDLTDKRYYGPQRDDTRYHATPKRIEIEKKDKDHTQTIIKDRRPVERVTPRKDDERYTWERPRQDTKLTHDRIDTRKTDTGVKRMDQGSGVSPVKRTDEGSHVKRYDTNKPSTKTTTTKRETRKEEKKSKREERSTHKRK